MASGMIAQQRKTELLTNNISNVNTPGFKAEQAGIRSFPEMLLSHIEHRAIPTDKQLASFSTAHVGAIGTGVYMQETIPNFLQGSLLETELPTDLAIAESNLPAGSSVFFRLENPEDGEFYTRNGNFTLDAEGFLVNPQGLYVLSDTGGRIQLANDDFSVSPEGQIIQEGVTAARIGIALSAAPETMAKEGNGLYRTADGTALPSGYIGGAAFSLQQGFLEQSNVDSGRTMTDLLTAYRAFEANQKVLQAYDRSMEKTVNEVGRVN